LNNVFSQKTSEINEVKHLFKVEGHKHDYSFVKNNKNEIQQVFSALFLFYKKFISSQDANSCVFYPSCSVYAFQSVKNNGIIIGALDALDRLTRCNGLSPELYDIHSETNLLYDPVEK